MSSAPEPPLPSMIIDPQTGQQYQRGRFLGRGLNSRCFQATNVATNKEYAVKIMLKPITSMLKNGIEIQRSLKHENIVQLVDSFEDEYYHYIIFELFKNKSMKELLTRRKTLTEHEIAYYLRHIAEALQYLQDSQVIHRDIKLAHVLINDKMVPKVGGFSLATRLPYKDDRIFSICGTPNYVAPEVLIRRNGHSFGVDIWALGVIAYALAVGKPPFEQADMKETYRVIRSVQFDSDRVMLPLCRDFILQTLQHETNRLTIDQVLEHPFLNLPSYIPRPPPLSCLSGPPPTPKSLGLPRKTVIDVEAWHRLKCYLP